MSVEDWVNGTVRLDNGSQFENPPLEGNAHRSALFREYAAWQHTGVPEMKATHEHLPTMVGTIIHVLKSSVMVPRTIGTQLLGLTPEDAFYFPQRLLFGFYGSLIMISEPVMSHPKSRPV